MKSHKQFKTNEQVEHKQEEVSSEEKKEETTPVQPTEQPVQNNEQKVGVMKTREVSRRY